MVAGERAGAAEHPVAGDDEGDRVLADRRADRAGGRGLADAAARCRNRSSPGRAGCASRVCQTRTSKSVPISTTRRGCSAGQRSGSKTRRASGAVDGPVLDVLGLRPAPAACRRARRRGRRRRRSRARRGRARSRRGSPRRRARGGSRSAASARRRRLEVARRHRLVGDEQVVQAARAREADLVGGVEHARRVGEQRLGVVERDRLQEGLRASARTSAGTGDAHGSSRGRHARRWPRARAGRASAPR